MALVRKILETTLTSGQTSVSFNDTDIPSSLLRVYTTDPEIFPTSQSLSGNVLSVDFDVQSSNLGVALEIVKQGLDIVDDVTSTDADKALSANQGKVLKDAIDAIVVPTVPEYITDLDDVEVTDITNGQVLAWDNTAQKFVNVNQSGGSSSLDNLTDVAISSISDGQILKYNSTTQKWENSTESAGGGSTITITTSDSSLYGETVSLTDGTTTLTTTFSNSGEATFTGVTLTGTLTITCDVYSMTKSVPYFGNYEFVFTTVPEGSTVLPTDDIQTWLACAGITDKSYTTLNEVLADSTTLLALMSDDNAANYLVRSTTWASGVTANSTAMTDIGANNYCANTLLSNSTWLNAICNSTYFESVLNAKVPTMTSATTPSGEASGLNYNNTYPPYRIFDGNDSTFCAINAPSNTETGMTDRWVQYRFTDAVKVNKFLMKYQNTYGSQHDYITKVKLQGSDDGNIFEDITIETISSTSEEKSFINDKAYEYYRFLIVDGTVTNYGQISWMILTLQLYGRADV